MPYLISLYLMAIIYCSSEADTVTYFHYIFFQVLGKNHDFFVVLLHRFFLLFKCITKYRVRFLILFLLIIKLFHSKSQHFFRGCFCGRPPFLLCFFLCCFPDHFINPTGSNESIPAVKIYSPNVLVSSVLNFSEFGVVRCFKVKTEILKMLSLQVGFLY